MDASKMEALGGLVTEVDAESPGAKAEQLQLAETEARAATEAMAWAVIPMAIGKLVCMMAPELEPLYDDKACQGWGEAMVPVAEKYGWSGPSHLPELQVVILSAGFAVPTYLALRARITEKKAEQRKEELRRAAASAIDAAPAPPPANDGS